MRGSLVALLAPGCAAPVAPRTPPTAARSADGTWRGEIATASFPAGRRDSLVLTMAPRGASPDTLAGSFSFWFPGACPVAGPAFSASGSGCSVRGALVGTRAGDTVALDLTYVPCEGPRCSPISKRGPAVLRADGRLDVSVGDYWPREAATGTLRRD